MRISIVGLGNLGLPIAACFARRGFDVIGIDVDEERVAMVNDGRMPQYEPGLRGVLFKKKIRAFTDHEKAMKYTPVSLIIVGTPSNPNGTFSSNAILNATTSMAKALRNKKYHLFIIGSTVMPGTVSDLVIPRIEEVSGKKLNKDFGVCYCPETVALGSVVNDFLNPEVVIIGESNEDAGLMAYRYYKRLVENKPQFRFMSIKSAELAKICLNNFLTMKISFANLMGNICDKFGADVTDVLDAVSVDSRVSPKFFSAGPAYGGTCFPRDTGALISLTDASLIKAVEEINDTQVGLLIAKIRQELDGKLGIIGMSFKPGTPVVTESPSVKIADAFNDVVFCDKHVPGGHDLLRLLTECDVCVLMHRDEGFIKTIENANLTNELTVIDPWRVLREEKLCDKMRLVC